MKQFDYIIAGAGAAGLTLAYLLTGYEDSQKTILVIDKASKSDNDRTWCFWEKGENLLETLIYKSWQKAIVRTSKWEETYTLAPYSYKMIRGIDFYEFMKRELDKTNITWVQEEVEMINPDGIVKTDQTEYKGKLVFDSTFQFEQLSQSSANTILQHFKGKVIRTKSEVFDPQTATYMDFGMEQEGDCRFGYILPFDSRTALVEYTLFNKQLLKEDEYERKLKAYIKQLGIQECEVLEEEYGIIPMTDFKFVSRQSDQVFSIGIKGGFAKASTGYTFLRGQKILQKMVQNIITGKAPDIDLPFHKLRFKTYDATLLSVLDSGKFTGEDIFGELFRKNGIHSMFKFLDEETNLAEEMKIMSTTPLLHFGKAFIQQLGK